MRTRTSSPKRNTVAAIVITAAGLAVGASACGSDDDTPTDDETPTVTDDLTDTSVMEDLTDTSVMEDMTDSTTGG